MHAIPESVDLGFDLDVAGESKVVTDRFVGCSLIKKSKNKPDGQKANREDYATVTIVGP
jgi:hypothetical protein